MFLYIVGTEIQASLDAKCCRCLEILESLRSSWVMDYFGGFRYVKMKLNTHVVPWTHT